MIDNYLIAHLNICVKANSDRTFSYQTYFWNRDKLGGTKTIKSNGMAILRANNVSHLRHR